MKTIIPKAFGTKRVKEAVKKLRKNMTLSEVSLGVKFLRFDDWEAKQDMDNVLKTIEVWIRENAPTPSPSREGS